MATARFVDAVVVALGASLAVRLRQVALQLAGFIVFTPWAYFLGQFGAVGLGRGCRCGDRIISMFPLFFISKESYDNFKCFHN